MKKLVYCLVATLGLLCLRGHFAHAQSSQEFLTQLQKTQRTVMDNARLDLSTLAPEQGWVLAQIKPDKNSGNARVITKYDEQGKPIPDSHPDMIFRDNGTLSSAVTLSGSPQVPASYLWQSTEKIEISMGGERESKDADQRSDWIYSLFTVGPGGIAIFRINEHVEGEEMFRPAYLIPDEWANFAAPALAFTRQNAALFEQNAAKTNEPRLRALIGAPNPFIGIAAARTLIESRLLQGEAAQQALGQSQGWRLATLVYLLLIQPEPDKQLPPDDRSETAEQMNVAIEKVIANYPLLLLISQAIDQAKDAQTLQGLAQGLTAAMARDVSHNLFAAHRIDLLFERVARKQATLKTRTTADIYLDNLFRFVGVGARK